MTRICVIGPSKKFFGGISVYTIRLSNALSASHQVSVLMMRNLLPKFMYPGKKHVGTQDCNMHLLPDIRTFDGMDWNSPASWLKAYRFLKRDKPDVIIMQWWSSSVAHMELFLALANWSRIKSRLILEMHEIVDPLEASKPLLRFYSRFLGKMIMRRTDAFVVHSKSMKEQAERTYRLPGDRVFVVPHGVYDIYSQDYTRESARQKLGITEPFVILYFGLIRKYKGVPLLVDAFNKLPEAMASHSKLIIAGEDWGDEKDLPELIGKSRYSKHILFWFEFIPDSDVPAYFAAADVVVLPYLRTSGSGVTSLAIAYGKPVIISDLEHTREALKEYPGAVFFPCGDVAAITERLTAAYARHQSGGTASFSIPANKSWEYVTNEYERVINNIL